MLKVIEGIVATAKRNAATPAVITGARAITYGQFLDGLARVSNHLVDRGLPSRSKLFLNIADPDLRSIVFIASIHAGFVPFALLDLAGVEEDAQPDFIVGASALHLPHLAADITIDQSVLAGKLSDGSLRAFPDQPSDALLIVNSTTGSTGRPKLVSGTYGALAAYERQQGAVPGVGYTASVPWPGLGMANAASSLRETSPDPASAES